MAFISATCLRFEPFLKQPSRTPNQSGRPLCSMLVLGGWARNPCPSLRTTRHSICCAAKSETVDRVCNIVKTQLALAEDTAVTPETTFFSLGADSLDTVEIVMMLEEEFGINIEDEGAEAISTIQDAADVIEELVGKKSEAQNA